MQGVGQLVAQPATVDGRRPGRGAGPLVIQRGHQNIRQEQDLDAAGAQHRRERVVLLLGPADPRDAVEQQLVVVARGEPLELRSRPVQQNHAQRPDLAVHAGHRLRIGGEVGGALSGHASERSPAALTLSAGADAS